MSGLCGFYYLGNYKQDEVYIKPMKLKDDGSKPLESLIRYYPYLKENDSVRKFIIPIKPKSHEDLFPDLRRLKGSLFEKDQSLYSCQGNTIKKAYLCHSKIKAIQQRNIVLFYRSKDKKSIQCIGIVVSVIFSEDINECSPLLPREQFTHFQKFKIFCRKRL